MTSLYCPIRIRTVKPGRDLTFDLYIFFKEHYLLYIENGAAINEEKFGKLKKQKIAKFYIPVNQEVEYQAFLDGLLKEVVSDPNASVDEKVSVVEAAGETAIENMHRDPESERSFKATQKAAKSLRQVIFENPSALKKIFGKKAAKDDEIIKHSLNVAVLSVKFAQKLKCTEEEIDDLGTAALVHDVGLTKLNDEERFIFKKPKKNFTPDDKRLYGLHTKDALQILTDKPYVNKNVRELVINHEEVLSGDGPQKKSKLSKCEQILSMVNCYDKKIITEGVTPAEAIKNMMIDDLGNYDLAMLDKFKKFLKEEGILEGVQDE